MMDFLKPFRELADSPPVRLNPGYLRRDLRHDLVSGLTVAVLDIPQSMAYAMIAGVPPIYGLYTSIISGITGAIFGCSRHLVTGPTNATCMVIFSVTVPYLDAPNHLEIIILLTLLTGIIKLAFGLLQMGGMVRYVSNSVVVGFTTGVAILIMGNQLANILGISLARTDYLHFYRVLTGTFGRIGETRICALLVACLTVAAVFAFKRLNRNMPGPLLSMILGSLLVYAAGWSSAQGIKTVQEISTIEDGLRFFHLPALIRNPDWVLTQNLLSGAFALAVFGLIEASTSSRAVAALSGQRLNYSRDFVAQGLANITGSFFSNFASSGSFVRTALCYQSGGRTRMAQFFCASFIAATIFLFASYIQYIPQACLAGLLVYVAYEMIAKQKNRIAMTWRSGGNSRLVLAATFLATLVLPLQYAIFAGIILSISLLLKITGKADIKILIPDEEGRFGELPLGQTTDSPIVLIDMEGDLYFAAVENLDLELERALSPQTRVVVLRMKRLRAVGSTAIAVLDNFRETLSRRNVALVICGVEKSLETIIKRSGLRDRIGEPNIFYADNTVFQSTGLAMARAHAVVEMQRLSHPAPAEPPPPEKGWPVAKDIMLRHYIRFGRGHTVREAIWLLSEASRRASGGDSPSLFLQDEEGRLAGELTPWRLIAAMSGDKPFSELEKMDDQALARRFRQSFEQIIGKIARTDLPVLETDTRFARLLKIAVEQDFGTLPICDPRRRLAGIVREQDLVGGLSRLLHAPPPEEEIKQGE